MKVGILTFSAAHNFGAILQCYGLFKTLEDFGHDVEVIDYCPNYLASYKPTFGWRQYINRHILSFPQRYSTYKYWRSIYDGYESFKKHNLKLSRQIKSVTEFNKISDGYDAIIIGSDQIWNEEFNGKEDVWYGEGINHKRLIAYAGSAGNIDRWLKNVNKRESLLANFDFISARECELTEAIKKLVDDSHNIPTVLDPSLLADKKHWCKWQNRIEASDYIVIYQARESDDAFRIAEDIKKQLKCDKLIILDFYDNVQRLGYNSSIVSPEDFISLISNAKCVVTTSFHGTAFSIILKTPFYTLRLNDGADGRSEYLLEKIGLSDRMIEASSTPVFTIPDFDEADLHLKKIREESLEFLMSSLS